MLGDIHRLIRAAGLDDLRPVSEWFELQRSGPFVEAVICHGDFHPVNVMVDGSVVTGMIGWGNIALSHPAFDVAITRLIASIGPIDGTGVPQEDLRQLIDSLVAEYLAAYRERRPLDDKLLRFYRVLRAAHAFTKVTAARTGLDVRGVAHVSYAWEHSTLLSGIRHVVQTETGTSLAMPATN